MKVHEQQGEREKGKYGPKNRIRRHILKKGEEG